MGGGFLMLKNLDVTCVTSMSGNSKCFNVVWWAGGSHDVTISKSGDLKFCNVP